MTKTGPQLHDQGHGARSSGGGLSDTVAITGRNPRSRPSSGGYQENFSGIDEDCTLDEEMVIGESN